MQVVMQSFQLAVVSTYILRSTSRMESVWGVAVLLLVAPNTSHHAAASRRTCLNTTTSAQVHRHTHNFRSVYYGARLLVHTKMKILAPLTLLSLKTYIFWWNIIVGHSCCSFTYNKVKITAHFYCILISRMDIAE